MPPASALRFSFSRTDLRRIGLALAGCVVVGVLVYFVAFALSLEAQRTLARQRLNFYALSLEATLTRYESLPGLLVLERDLAALLASPSDAARRAAANRYLETVQGEAGVAAAYLIDRDGNTLAASNWYLPQSFVGQNYAFRPYFREALAGRLGRFYAVGATTGEPGYFLAAPVRLGGQVRGVVAVKVGLEAFEQALAKSGDTVMLADAAGIVFLSSLPDWRYRALAPLDAETRARLVEQRQYGSHPLSPLAPGSDLRRSGGGPVPLALPDGRQNERLVQAQPVGHLGWSLVLLSDPAEARVTALVAGVAAGFASAFAAAVAAHLRLRRRREEERRRAHHELEARIAERTADLSAKVAELERTEAILRRTRDAAVQTGKLAVLGQMSAGMSHELNQPLAALHTFSDNAVALLDLGRLGEVRENLQTISQLTGRLGTIVTQLKSFARKAPEALGPVPVDNALANALLIVEPRRRELGATIDGSAVRSGRYVVAEAVRLEQVLVNLLRNGLDAVSGHDEPRLELRVAEEGGRVRIAVRDNGPGIPADALPHLFEPFYTTKPAGEGLGLGLAISLAIVEGFGGRLEAKNLDGSGAEFALLLDSTACGDAPCLI
ncbi:sensor histidine kinase [Azospira restricta]|uniref:C4-dicarboxylate transport sensor protein DctB n=2 Tax=Azospira restricta TaxID=404405 RepID=A0A974Y5Y0_9RHOO|nr:sensor histidine kinase [Azospira restricta]